MDFGRIDELLVFFADLVEAKRHSTPACRRHCIVKVYHGSRLPPAERLSRAFAICTKKFPDASSPSCKKHAKEPAADLKRKDKDYENVLKQGRSGKRKKRR